MLRTPAAAGAIDMRLRWPWRQPETLMIQLLDEAIAQSRTEAERARLIAEAVTEELSATADDNPADE